MDKALEELELFGLLYLSDNEATVNVTTKGAAEAREIYLYNAIALSDSLRRAGIRFTLLTNDMQTLERLAPPGRLNIKEIGFSTFVPPGARFYAAHHKIDAFKYLSTHKTPYVGLCDLDMLCINNVPPSFLNNIRSRTPMCYDISDQTTPTYGPEVLISTLNKITGLEGDGRWFGGEFLTGPPDFFRELVDLIQDLYESYLNHIDVLHHQGDEAVTSGAIMLMRRNGVCIADAGTLGIVGRYWNRPVRHPQRPFEWFERCFLLHLPADKRFLERVGRKTTRNHATALHDYIKHKNSLHLRLKNQLRTIRMQLRA